MPDAFIETYNRIVTEFFPQSTQYEYAENVEFEVYSSADVSNPNYKCEIWIAVNEKAQFHTLIMYDGRFFSTKLMTYSFHQAISCKYTNAPTA